MNLLNSVSASEAKAKFYDVLNQVRDGEVVQVIRHSRPEAVLMSVDRYRELMERLEDLEDSLDMIKAEMASEGTIPLNELKNRLGASAVVQS